MPMKEYLDFLHKMEERCRNTAKGHLTHQGNEYFRSHSFCAASRGNCSKYGAKPAKRREVFAEHKVGLSDQALGYLEAYA